jgi:hypothetical protein
MASKTRILVGTVGQGVMMSGDDGETWTRISVRNGTASRREWNHSMLRHSSRNLPLNLSSVPFCQGFPGSMSAV